MLRSIMGLLAACVFTAAGAQQLTENFDNVAGLAGAGWSIINNSAPAGSTAWFQGNTAVFTSQGGAANSYAAANFNAAAFGGNASLWALSPVLNLQDGVVVSFYTRTEASAPAPDRLELRMSLNGASTNVGATDTSVGDFTNVLVSVNPGQTAGGYPSTWTQFTVTLSGLPPGVTQGRIGFRYFVTNTAVNGDYIGIDSLVVSGGPPDMTIAKSHVGNFAQGQVGAAYTLTATNSGGQPTSGTVTVVDTLPAGLTATAMSGAGWTCTLGTLTCTRSDALAAGASYPAITLTVNVSGSAPASVTNTATVSGGGETNTGNNTASDPTTIGATFADLAIAKSHVGNFAQGQVGASYTIVVSNGGANATSGTVTVVDTLPASMTATAMGGSGWSCVLGTLTCTRSDSLAAASSYPPITLTVNVSAVAPPSVANVATVSGGGDNTPANNTTSDTTTITAVLPDLTITKSHTGNFFLGQAGATYTIVVGNAGPGATSGTVTVIDTLPAGLTGTAMAGTGWTCTLATLTCTRADSLAAGASYPPITLTVNVAPSAPASVVNVVAVSGGGDTTPGNSTASDSTVIAATTPPQVQIPTLGEWALLMLMGMMALVGAGALRRRR
ncbi:MAG: IPTL-CTERM sorting domain-containing protein [Burkholderiales bacterium]